MIIFINDKVQRISNSVSTLEELVKSVCKADKILSVTLNDVDIDRKKWKTTGITDLDRVVII